MADNMAKNPENFEMGYGEQTEGMQFARPSNLLGLNIRERMGGGAGGDALIQKLHILGEGVKQGNERTISAGASELESGMKSIIEGLMEELKSVPTEGMDESERKKLEDLKKMKIEIQDPKVEAVPPRDKSDNGDWGLRVKGSAKIDGKANLGVEFVMRNSASEPLGITFPPEELKVRPDLLITIFVGKREIEKAVKDVPGQAPGSLEQYVRRVTGVFSSEASVNFAVRQGGELIITMKPKRKQEVRAEERRTVSESNVLPPEGNEVVGTGNLEVKQIVQELQDIESGRRREMSMGRKGALQNELLMRKNRLVNLIAKRNQLVDLTQEAGEDLEDVVEKEVIGRMRKKYLKEESGETSNKNEIERGLATSGNSKLVGMIDLMADSEVAGMAPVGAGEGPVWSNLRILSEERKKGISWKWKFEDVLPKDREGAETWKNFFEGTGQAAVDAYDRVMGDMWLGEVQGDPIAAIIQLRKEIEEKSREYAGKAYRDIKRELLNRLVDLMIENHSGGNLDMMNTGRFVSVVSRAVMLGVASEEERQKDEGLKRVWNGLLVGDET